MSILIRMCPFLEKPAMKITHSKTKLNHSVVIVIEIVIEKHHNMTVKNK